MEASSMNVSIKEEPESTAEEIEIVEIKQEQEDGNEEAGFQAGFMSGTEEMFPIDTAYGSYQQLSSLIQQRWNLLRTERSLCQTNVRPTSENHQRNLIDSSNARENVTFEFLAGDQQTNGSVNAEEVETVEILAGDQQMNGMVAEQSSGTKKGKDQFRNDFRRIRKQNSRQPGLKRKRNPQWYNGFVNLEDIETLKKNVEVKKGRKELVPVSERIQTLRQPGLIRKISKRFEGFFTGKEIEDQLGKEDEKRKGKGERPRSRRKGKPRRYKGLTGKEIGNKQRNDVVEKRTDEVEEPRSRRKGKPQRYKGFLTGKEIESQHKDHGELVQSNLLLATKGNDEEYLRQPASKRKGKPKKYEGFATNFFMFKRNKKRGDNGPKNHLVCEKEQLSPEIATIRECRVYLHDVTQLPLEQLNREKGDSQNSFSPESNDENNQNLLKKRRKKRVNEIARRKKILRKLICQICSKDLTHMSNYKRIRHAETHGIMKKSLECPCCPRSFSSRHHYAVHMRLHSGEAYSCPHCHRQFPLKSNFRNHLKIHTGQGKVSCDICGKSFFWKNSIRLHMPKHFGGGAKTNATEIFKCVLCHRSYGRERDLLLHAVVHFNAKMYECDECSKSFFRKSSLARHQRNHSTFKRFVCPYCPYKATRKYALDSHLREGVCMTDKFWCDFCKKPKPYSLKQYLRNHIFNRHLVKLGNKTNLPIALLPKMNPRVVLHRLKI